MSNSPDFNSPDLIFNDFNQDDFNQEESPAAAASAEDLSAADFSAPEQPPAPPAPYNREIDRSRMSGIELAALELEAAQSEFARDSSAVDSSGHPLWKREVANRVHAHRSRRRRPEVATGQLSFAKPIPTDTYEALKARALRPSRRVHAEAGFEPNHQKGRIRFEPAESQPVQTAAAIAAIEEADFLEANSETRLSPGYPESQLSHSEPQLSELELSEDELSEAAFSEAELSEATAFRVDAPETRVHEGIRWSQSDHPPARSSASLKLLSFPRAPELPVVEALADPVVSNIPRILDAPEEVKEAIVPSTLFDVHLDPEDDDIPVRMEVELPLQVAPLVTRIYSAILDWLIVLIAAFIFAVTTVGIIGAIPLSKTAWLLAATVLSLLWGTYQYLFLVYAGFTPGMQMAQLELSTFGGENPTLNQRRGRAMAAVVSCISMGMGFIWALLDEDHLGWHDRITRTCLRQL